MAVAVAALALSASIASSASASVVPAKFSTANFKMTTSSITLKRNGLEPKTCTLNGTLVGAGESGSYFASNQADGSTRYFCSGGGQFTGVFMGSASYDTVTGRYYLTYNGYGGMSFFSPYGESYYAETRGLSSGTWVNGSGSTPSKVTFTDQTVGYTTAGKRLSMDAVFTVTTEAGGLITLSH